jgi:hypothetical protein
MPVDLEEECSSMNLNPSVLLATEIDMFHVPIETNATDKNPYDLASRNHTIEDHMVKREILKDSKTLTIEEFLTDLKPITEKFQSHNDTYMAI